jgi:DNA-binding NarL/FixJ family response regulator
MHIRVVLADDHTRYRESVRCILDSDPHIVVVAEVSSGTELIQFAVESHPDVAVVDVRMKDMNGIDTIGTLREKSPATAVLMLSVYDDKQYVSRAVKAGAKGYLVKDAASEILADAIRAVYGGRYYFDPKVRGFAEKAIRETAGSRI